MKTAAAGSMNAAVLHGAGDLRLEPRPMPAPGPNMALLRVRRFGICGSDLHYFDHGRCGAFVPDRPFVLGHEFSAEVAAVGAGPAAVKVGDRVAVNPARCCGRCGYCKTGRPNLCRRMVMLGSASTTPPTDGAFAEFVTVRVDQCHPVPPGMDDSIAAMIEPFAVALHAVRRAGPISGKRVLVSGCGTIGLLAAMTARAHGGAPIAASDPVATRREKALSLGADLALDPGSGNMGDQIAAATDGGFDVVMEASGSVAALRQAFDAVRDGGTIVQIGTLGAEEVLLPANQIMRREIDLVGSMRYADPFDEAIRIVASGRVDLRSMVSDVLPFDQTVRALRVAGDKSHSLKVHVRLF